jgi:hypothetical protein
MTCVRHLLSNASKGKTVRERPVLRLAYRPRATASAVVILLVLSACANPYAPPSTLAEPPAATVRPPELAHAFALAEQQHATYRAKVVELGESERNFSNSVFVLGTGLLGMAAANVHSSALKAGALATGAVYGAGVFNTDRRRGQIYLQGMATLECAVAAVQPLSLGTQSETIIKKDRERIAEGMVTLSNAVAAARTSAMLAQLYDPTTFETTIKAINAEIVQARAVMDAAAKADQLSRQRLEVPATAAMALRNTIHGVDREVLQQIESTQPALQSIPNQLTQLKTNALFTALAGLSTDTATTPPTATSKKEEPHAATFTTADEAGKKVAANRAYEIAQATSLTLGNLEAANLALKGIADRISSAAAATATQTSEALKTCKVEDVVKPLTATQSTVRIAAGSTLIQQIFVEGGNGNLRAGFTQKPVPGLAVNVPPGTLGLIEIQASEKSVAGTYPLLVEDSTLSSRITISVVVEAGTATASATPIDAAKNPANSPVSALIETLKKRQDITLADGSTVKIVEIKPRGTTGIEVTFSTPNAAIKPEQVEQALKGDKDVNNVLGDKADVKAARASAVPNAAIFQIPGAARMPSAQVQRLQARLCMPATQRDGIWGRLTQHALEQDRAARDKRMPVPSGELADKERDQLLALTDEQADARCQQRGVK